MNDSRRGAIAVLAVTTVLVSAVAVVWRWPVPARVAIVAAVCLVAWLSELVPVWAPTVVLWVLVPSLLAGAGAAYRPAAVLRWSADPVIALFLSGFAFAAAARRWGVDTWLMTHAVRWSRGEPSRFIVLAAFVTLGLSMWMSNIAAAALVFGALRPVLHARETSDTCRRALLLAVTLSADVGGVATPIGSGPNGIAMAAVERVRAIGFVDWMAFGVPLAVGLVAVVLVMVHLRFRPTGRVDLGAAEALGPRAWALCAVLGTTAALWLTERVHGWPAWVVGVSAVCVMVLLGLLGPRDVRRIDWSTLLLIAGGIGLGTLLDRSGTVHLLASRLPLDAAPHGVAILGLCVASALLSALMSNTATAMLLIPFAATIDPSPSTAILVAVAASLGVPFVISTPPNAMAVANGLRARDLLVPGMLLMLGGCVAIALTGPWVLRAVGIP